jgi:hypothetical protein
LLDAGAFVFGAGDSRAEGVGPDVRRAR